MPNKKNKFLTLVFAFSFFLFPFSFAFAANLESAKMSYLKEDYSEAIIECQNILKYSPPLTLKTETLYLMGLSYLKLNETVKSQEVLQEALNQNPPAELKEKIELALGETYYLNGEIDKAQSQFKKILSDYPKSSFAPTIYFHLGHCALKSGLWDEAKSYFTKINREYPLSLEAPVAQEVLNNSEFYFTIQIGSFINEKNANELCQNLKNKGYDAYLTEFKSSSATYHRVRVGKYDLKSAALNEEEKLKADGFPTHIWP